jgi:hypothetical protein
LELELQALATNRTPSLDETMDLQLKSGEVPNQEIPESVDLKIWDPSVAISFFPSPEEVKESHSSDP